MKITINQSVTRTETVEKVITVPCFRKEKDSLPHFVAILSEKSYVKVFLNNDGYASIQAENDGTVASYFDDNKYIDCAEEEFNEAFKKAIEILSQSACHFATDYMIHIESIPTEESVKP